MATTHRVGGRLAAGLAICAGLLLLAPLPMALADDRAVGLLTVASAVVGAWAVVSCRRESAVVAVGRVALGLAVLAGLAIVAVAEGLPIPDRGLDPALEVAGALLLVAAGSLTVLTADPVERPSATPSNRGRLDQKVP